MMPVADDQDIRALLVGVVMPEQPEGETRELLAELAELADTFGAEVAGEHVARARRPQSRYFVGSGAAAEIVEESRQQGANLIIVDHDLSPSQQRNWERLAGGPVIDRRAVILDIFAARASTKEAVLQIELARSRYLLPRLKGAWSHFSRQRGNAKMRGEGEKQIEMDERMVRQHIARLEEQLRTVRQRRAEQRKKRRQKPVPNAAIVGYTNAGKSMLLNRLTQSEVLVEDKLFATLDPTTRRLELPNNQTLLLTDTVGFVRKLPHSLVEAFKSTLEEATLADFLIHVIDLTSASCESQYRTTCEVLQEIGAGDCHAITVFNKTDCDIDRSTVRRLRRHYPDAFFISAKTGAGLELLVKEMARVLDAGLCTVTLRIPHACYDVMALLHRTSHVRSESYEDEAVYVQASVPRECWRSVQQYVVPETMLEGSWTKIPGL